MLAAVLWPLTVTIAPKHQRFYAMSVICAAKIWEKHSAAPRGVFFLFFFFIFCWKDSNRNWNGSNSCLPPAPKFIENMIYLQAAADPVWEGHVASTLNSISCMGSVIFLRNAPVIKWNWDKGHCNAQISSKCTLCRDVNVNAIKSITFTASLPSWCPVHLRESWLASCKSVNLSNGRSALFQHVPTFRGNEQFSSCSTCTQTAAGDSFLSYFFLQSCRFMVNPPQCCLCCRTMYLCWSWWFLCQWRVPVNHTGSAWSHLLRQKQTSRPLESTGKWPHYWCKRLEGEGKQSRRKEGWEISKTASVFQLNSILNFLSYTYGTLISTAKTCKM